MTPPAELLKKWEDLWFSEQEHADVLLIEAYQAGADAELGACCSVLDGLAYEEAISSEQLRVLRRPKRINLRRVALLQLEQLDAGRAGDVIRQALEQLPDD